MGAFSLEDIDLGASVKAALTYAAAALNKVHSRTSPLLLPSRTTSYCWVSIVINKRTLSTTALCAAVAPPFMTDASLPRPPSQYPRFLPHAIFIRPSLDHACHDPSKEGRRDVVSTK